MQNNNSFMSFYPVESMVHKLNSIIKLLTFILFLVPIIGSVSIKLHVFIVFLIFVLMYYSKVPLKFYFNMIYGLRYCYLIILFFLASKGLSLESAVLIFIKITSVIEYLAVIFYTTSPSEIKYAIEKVLNLVNLFNINLGKFSNRVVGLITFFPLLFITEKEILVTSSAKGLDYIHADILSRIIVRIKLFASVFRKTKEKIKNIKTLAELRMYDVNKFRTNLRCNKVNFSGVLVIFVHLILIIFYLLEEGII